MNTATNANPTQITQGAAVVQAVKSVLKGDYKLGVKVALSDEQRKAVTEILVKGFTDRAIALKASSANDAKLKDPKLLGFYVKGLIQNWLTKSPELNGRPKPVKAAAAPAATPASAAPAVTPPAAETAKPEAKVAEAPKPGKDAGVMTSAKKPTATAKK